MQGVDLQQSAKDRAAYITCIAGVPVEYLVFIDESGVAAKDTYRDKSWMPKGTQSKQEVRVCESKHLTLLPAVTEAGMIAGTVYKGAVERVHVEMFLKRNLLPVMKKFPGHHSVLVLDNSKVHHGGIISTICQEAGI
ncbi:hypothetical protein CROQUDRAFT_93565 [Cronartium quercuum f. sp. fusiforme G11]|uniref:Tc1-like transposase DDE domain-containing protein n=1 Tax=Cronartium quercuum f. sp. fusiforme G11 TaxID=708437 RepID=A0A9P6TBI8_9BASI|nr:hypothetical protein CROQUDRAFT_93565 [Cronartium quercuum f. sp. fusiforme G11]